MNSEDASGLSILVFVEYNVTLVFDKATLGE